MHTPPETQFPRVRNNIGVSHYVPTRHTLPETGFLRIKNIIGDPHSVPPIPAVYPVGRATWWAGVASGKYPKGVKLGARVTAWRVEDIRALVLSVGDEL
jgi:prophage regulatory protein